MKTTKQSSKFPAGNALQPHSIADTVPGVLSTEEFDALCISIQEDGQRLPIVLFEGKILDGRARYAACKKLDIAPITEVFKGTTAEAAAAYVVDTNLHRRQLNSMQKALVAARMCNRDKAPLTQKDAAARVGVGVATVNLAVRLLASNNTPLIKRCERGDATRAEIDELLFDREAARQSVAAIEAGADATAGSADEDLIGSTSKTPGNVVNIADRRPSVAGNRPSAPHSKETAASRCVGHFRALTAKEQKDFVEMAWRWLQPALVAHGVNARTVLNEKGTAKPTTKAAKGAKGSKAA